MLALEYRQADLDVEVGAEAIELLAAPGFRRRIGQGKRRRQRRSCARYFVQKTLDILPRHRARAVGEQHAGGDFLPRSASRTFDRLPGQIAASPAKPAAGLGEFGGKRVGQRIAAHRLLRLEMHDAFDVYVGRCARAFGARRGQDIGQRLGDGFGRHRRQIVGLIAGLDRRARRRRRLAAQLRLDALPLGLHVRRLPKRRLDAAARPPLLRPVVEDDDGDQRDAGGEKAEEQRVHIHAGRAYCGTVSANSSASAMSTATTRDTPGSAIVIPIS